MEPEVTFPANWSAPYELTRALPRDVQRTGRGTFMAVMASIFLLAAIPAFLIVHNQTLKQVARIESLAQRGRDATGAVTRLYREGKSSTPTLDYAFEAGGARITGHSTAPISLWQTLRVGDPLPIRFLPEDPSVNHPGSWPEQPIPAWLRWVLPGVLLFLGGLFAWLVRAEARLLENGVPAPAVVTKCRRVKGGYSVSYWFRMKDGTPRRGMSNVPHYQEPGADLIVLYDPEKPRRSKPYPLTLYRLAP